MLRGFLLSISRFYFRKGRTLVSVLNNKNKGDPELQPFGMTFFIFIMATAFYIPRRNLRDNA